MTADNKPTLLEDLARGASHVVRGLGHAADLHRHITEGPADNTGLGRAKHIGRAVATGLAIVITGVELAEHMRDVRTRRTRARG